MSWPQAEGDDGSAVQADAWRRGDGQVDLRPQARCQAPGGSPEIVGAGWQYEPCHQAPRRATTTSTSSRVLRANVRPSYLDYVRGWRRIGKQPQREAVSGGDR